jgi:hypothetical protein
LTDQPKFIKSPNNQTKNVSGTVLLTCEFEGKPFPTQRWQKNGQNLSLVSNATRIAYKGYATLQIFTLGRSDEGFYRCTATNYIASAHSTEGFVAVNCKL